MYYDHNSVAAVGAKAELLFSHNKNKKCCVIKIRIGSISHSHCIKSLQLPKAFWYNVNYTEGDFQDNLHMELNLMKRLVVLLK